jgi:hypothetical protein
MQVKREMRLRARAMRAEGKSLNQIATALGAAKSTISLWVRDVGLSEDQIADLRSRGSRLGGQNRGAQVNRERARAQRLVWQKEGRERAAHHSTRLHFIGCLLYWAEGAKTHRMVHFVNSDQDMLLVFMRFLREEMQVADEKIKIHVQCHTSDSAEIQRIERYWLDLFALPDSALKKTRIRPSSLATHNHHVNGICTIRVQSTALTQRIMGAVQEYMQIDRPEWLG